MFAILPLVAPTRNPRATSWVYRGAVTLTTTGAKHPMTAYAKKLWNDTSGQGLAEYALLLGIIVVGVIVLLQGMGMSIQKIFTKANSDLETAAAAAS